MALSETWTEQHIAELCRLWDLGLSAGEIARTMGLSKNMIVGKAHRLGLSSRPSPIKARGIAAEPEPMQKPVAPINVEPSGCRFPLWRDDEAPTHEYCGKRRRAESPYCDHHHGIAFVRRGTSDHEKLSRWLAAGPNTPGRRRA